jgi:MFS family permease
VVVSRGHPNPFLDLDLFRISSFRHSVLGAALFRMGVGATPFLFPLMLQIGLGMSPLASGLTTFTSAIGAITMKFTARPILRRFGFRRTMIGNSLLIGALIALAALFSIATPLALIIGLLLASGFFRSLQFTSINALTFADVPPLRMSRATSISSVTQQVAISLGITVGALAVELSRRAHGDTSPSMADFAIAFPLVGAMTAASAIVFLRLRPDAGDDVSGRSKR